MNRKAPKVREFVRNNVRYVGFFEKGVLIRLISCKTHQDVPRESQSFRRLADGNRGGKFKELPEREEHIVVLAYSERAGGYAGIRTWTPYPSKAEFDTWYGEHGHKEYDIVAQGVDEDTAVELCQRTPLLSHVRATIEESTDPDTGRVNLELAEMRMFSIMVARRGRVMPVY